LTNRKIEERTKGRLGKGERERERGRKKHTETVRQETAEPA